MTELCKGTSLYALEILCLYTYYKLTTSCPVQNNHLAETATSLASLQFLLAHGFSAYHKVMLGFILALSEIIDAGRRHHQQKVSYVQRAWGVGNFTQTVILKRKLVRCGDLLVTQIFHLTLVLRS